MFVEVTWEKLVGGDLIAPPPPPSWIGLRDHVIIPDTVKITFNLDIASTDKPRSVANNAGRALVKKKVLLLGSKEIDTINNSYIYDMYKDLYLSKKEREKNLLQGIQSVNGWKTRVDAKNQMVQHWQWQPNKILLKRCLIKGLQYR